MKRSFSPNLIVQEGVAKNFSNSDFSKAKKLSKWSDTVLIGPGLGKDPKTIEFFEKFILWILEEKIPCVVDADGIKMLGKLIKEKNLELLNSPIILTPHIAELKNLVEFENLPKSDDIEKRAEKLINLLQKIGGVFLVKGVYDHIIKISEKESIYRVNRTGCPEMSVGGTGDVLSGLTSAFFSIGNTPFNSACAAAYLNGLLGETAKKSSGPRINATDLIKNMKSLLLSKKL